MAIKHFSFSLVFLATATILLFGQSYGLRVNLCRRADYRALCYSVVKGLRNPNVATAAAIHRMISDTAGARKLAARLGRSDDLDVCKESYGDAVSNLKTCLVNLRRHDKASLKINLSAALSAYQDCNDALVDFGKYSRLSKTNTVLRRMASNGLYLASLIH